MDLVGNPLVVGVGVNRGHQALLDAEGLVQDLGHRSQAVGGARGVGHDLHAGIQDMIVDAHHEGRVELVLRRSAQHDPIGTRVDVFLEFLAAGEEARRLQRDLASQALPGEIGGVTLGEDGNRLAVDHQSLLGGLDSPREPPVDAVVLEQHRKVLRVREVVDRHDLELVGVLGQDTKDETPDSTKTVDTNTDCHDWTPGALGKHTSYGETDPLTLPGSLISGAGLTASCRDSTGHRSARIEAWIVASQGLLRCFSLAADPRNQTAFLATSQVFGAAPAWLRVPFHGLKFLWRATIGPDFSLQESPISSRTLAAALASARQARSGSRADRDNESAGGVDLRRSLSTHWLTGCSRGVRTHCEGRPRSAIRNFQSA